MGFLGKTLRGGGKVNVFVHPSHISPSTLKQEAMTTHVITDEREREEMPVRDRKLGISQGCQKREGSWLQWEKKSEN